MSAHTWDWTCCCPEAKTCPSDCTDCSSYSLVTSGIGAGGGCVGLNGTFAMEKYAVDGCSTCQWRVNGSTISWRIICEDKIWKIKADSDVVIFGVSNSDNCPPTGAYPLLSSTCGTPDTSAATLTRTNPRCPCSCRTGCPHVFKATIAGFAGGCAVFNGTWTMERGGSASCLWSYSSAPYTMTLQCGGNGVWALDIIDGINSASWSSTSDRAACPPTGTYGGCAATCSCAGVTATVAAG